MHELDIKQESTSHLHEKNRYLSELLTLQGSLLI